MRTVTLSTVLLVTALTMGCGSSYDSSGSSDSMTTNRLVGTAWELTLIQLPGGERLPVDEVGAYRIAYVEDQRFVVKAGNNQCVGHYNSTGRALTVRLDCPMASSFPPGSVGKEFLVVLNSSYQFGMTSSGSEMYIDSAGRKSSLSFRRLSASELNIPEEQPEG